MRGAAEVLRYRYLDTILSRLDPRIKIVISIAYSIPTIIFGGFIQLLVIYIPILLNLALGKVLSKYFKTILYLTPFMILITILNYLTMGNIVSALTPVIRIVILIAALDIFFLTTDPDNFILTLESFKLPLSISLSFALALRFIPSMVQQINEIVEAQLSRGLQLDKGNIFTRIRNYIPIIVPLVILSIKRSIEVAESLEIRGVHPKARRTHYIELKIKRSDLIYLIGNLLIVIVISMIIMNTPFLNKYLPEINF